MLDLALLYPNSRRPAPASQSAQTFQFDRRARGGRRERSHISWGSRNADSSESAAFFPSLPHRRTYRRWLCALCDLCGETSGIGEVPEEARGNGDEQGRGNAGSGHARKAGAVRSKVRARQLRGRVRRRRQRTKVPPHYHPGPDCPEEPASSRGLRVRAQYRRWDGDPHSDAPRLLRQSVRADRHHPTGATMVQHRTGVPPHRSCPGSSLPGHVRRDHPGGGPNPPGVAGCADG